MKKQAKIVEAYIKSSTPQEMMYDVIEKMQQMKLEFTEMHAHIDRDVRDVETIKKVIRPLIPKVRDGIDGKDAHTPTKIELLEIIKPLIPEVKDGEDGIDGSPDKPDDIRDKLASLKGKERLSVFSLKDTEWLKGKGERNVQWNAVGGLSKVATDDTLTGDGTDSSPLHVVGGGGGGSFSPSTEKSTTTPNGSTQTFAFAHTPTVIFWNGSFQFLGVDYTVSGNSITFLSDTPLAGDTIVNVYGTGFIGSTEQSTTTPNGSRQTFAFAHTPTMIFWNGSFQFLSIDYSVSGNNITFLSGTPLSGDIITNVYA